MAEKKQKTAAELKAEQDLMMAKAAIKTAVMSFMKKDNIPAPQELVDYWAQLKTDDWKEHLDLFENELKKNKSHKIKSLLFDLDGYIADLKASSQKFDRSRAEFLLMVAIGQIQVKELMIMLEALPSNREKLDRKIEKQIKQLDWQDHDDLAKLDDLTQRLENPRIKKSEVDQIDKEIDSIEKKIKARKSVRDELALKLVEWRARGNVDIASSEGDFRLDA